MNHYVGAFMALAGLAAIIYAVRQIFRSNRAQSWPMVPGKVVESRLREVNDSDGTTYQAYVAYEYFVNGVALHSDIRCPGANQSSSSFTGGAKRVLARYPIGSEIIVYVNPADSADAMLEPGKIQLGLLAWGILFLLGGVLCFFDIHN
jgi:hypothetical protein